MQTNGKVLRYISDQKFLTFKKDRTSNLRRALTSKTLPIFKGYVLWLPMFPNIYLSTYQSNGFNETCPLFLLSSLASLQLNKSIDVTLGGLLLLSAKHYISVASFPYLSLQSQPYKQWEFYDNMDKVPLIPATSIKMSFEVSTDVAETERAFSPNVSYRICRDVILEMENLICFNNMPKF